MFAKITVGNLRFQVRNTGFLDEFSFLTFFRFAVGREKKEKKLVILLQFSTARFQIPVLLCCHTLHSSIYTPTLLQHQAMRTRLHRTYCSLEGRTPPLTQTSRRRNRTFSSSHSNPSKNPTCPSYGSCTNPSMLLH